MQKTVPKATASPKAPKPGFTGLRDITTQSSHIWSGIMQHIRTVAQLYGFKSIETSMLEEEKTYTEFYKNQPQMLDKILYAQMGGKPVGVRSELLPSVIRQYTQLKTTEETAAPLSKWMYIGNVVELDARGSIHFNYQFGFEVFGTFNHLTEAQVVSAVWDIAQRLGLDEYVQLEINTSGDANVQISYANVLKDYVKGKEFELCDDCNMHIRGRVLNVLRCNNVECQVVLTEAPAIVDFLDADARKRFTDILEALDELGLPYQLNQLYVGAEGTSGTNLVLKYKKGNHSIILGEAGHHEMLVKSLAGKAAPAFGFTGNLSAWAKAMELSEIEAVPDTSNEVFLVPLGELACKRSLRLFRDLIAVNVKVHDHFGSVGVKNQLKLAEESKAAIALIMGQKEAMDEMVILRDVKSGMQEVFSYDKIVIEVKKRLER